MLGTSFPYWTGDQRRTAADGPGASAPSVESEAVPWMTTNGPLLTFDLVRPRTDAEAVKTGAEAR